MKLLFNKVVLAFAMLALHQQQVAAQKLLTIDFENTLSSPESHFHSPTNNSVPVPGDLGSQNLVGSIELSNVHFSNSFSETYGSWSGFALSNVTNNIDPGWENQFSSIAGGGADGSATYAIGFGNHNVMETILNEPFDPSNSAHLQNLPSIHIPTGSSVVSFDVTNTTYAAFSMLHGDTFAKAFGGLTGNDPDYFNLNIYGIDATGYVLPQFIEVSLADYSFQNNSLDYILNEWRTVDLSELSSASSLHFNLVSSDYGLYGMNTPAYFAMDNLTIAAVPEPTSLALCGLATIVIAGRRRWRFNSKRRLAFSNQISELEASS